MNATTHFFPVEADGNAVKRTLEGLKYVSNLRMLTNLSTKCINLSADNAKTEINQALQEFALNISADRAYLRYYDFTNNTMRNSYEWCRNGCKSHPDVMQDIPISDHRYWADKHQNGDPVLVDNVSSLSPGALRNMLVQEDTRSHISIPMMHEDRCLGFVGFDWMTLHHHFSGSEQDFMQQFAGILTNLSLRIKYEEELKAAKEKAEESSRLKSAFLASISHELRTPLNAVIGYSSIIKNMAADDTLREYSDIICKNGDGLITIIDDILDIAMSEHRNINLKLGNIQMQELFQNFEFQLDEILNKSEKNDRIRLLFSIDDHLREQSIISDKSKINQIMANLFKNAVRFTDEGEIVVGCQKSGDEQLSFFVKDSGIGIPEEELDYIFDFFRQGDGSPSYKSGGIGVGLAISNRLTVAMGGELSVESGPSNGSVFTLKIPMNISEV